MSKDILTGIQGVLEWVERFTLRINIFIALAMMLVVVYGTMNRYVFNAPVLWVAELTEFMMVAMAFLVLAHVQGRGQHVRVTFFLGFLNKRIGKFLDVLTTLCALGVFILVTWAGWEFALKALRAGFRTDAVGFPLFPARLLVPAGSILMCLRLCADLIRSLRLLLGYEPATHMTAEKPVH